MYKGPCRPGTYRVPRTALFWLSFPFSNDEPSSASRGFIWEPHGSNDLAETKKGVPLCNGMTTGFEVWAYRIGIKLGALNYVKDKDDKRQKLIE